MISETRNCQNCKTDFTIEPEDFGFYEKIKVPPPTWCPMCRLQRKMAWRNEHFMFRKKDIHGKDVFSTFPPNADVRVLDSHEWVGDKWDQDESAMDCDFSRPFLEQFLELRKKAPVPSRSVTNMINSDYVNNGIDVKDSYLCFAILYSENCYYSENINYSKDCIDSSQVANCETSYNSFKNWRCNRAFYSSFCEDCYNIEFCSECIGCTDCFGCVGLRNKTNYFFNQPLSREEYLKRTGELRLGKRSNLGKIKADFEKLKLSFPVKYAKNYRNENCVGEYLLNSKNVQLSYDVIQGENLKYCYFLSSGNTRDSYDYYRYGANAELMYETASSGSNTSNMKFCYQCWANCSNLTYSYQCTDSNNLFGCVGLRNQSYRILNKQYSKEEYEDLVPKIIEHMKVMPYVDQKGRVYKYGEFFPPEFSPQGYNASIVQEYFPLTKDQVEELGWKWHELEDRENKASINWKDLPDDIGDATEAILGQAISCEDSNSCIHECTSAFKITPHELAFYKQYDLPLPTKCPNCRYFERIAERAPIKLWHRQCMCAGKTCDKGIYQNTVSHPHADGHCPNEFETSYSPDRPEIVYCESCYNSEVA